jgi:hypothetical protein
MRLRKIRVKLLGASGVVYRLHVILVQTIFFFILTGRWEWALGASIAWNVINTALYYNYHYWFARLFRLGVNDDDPDNRQ